MNFEKLMIPDLWEQYQQSPDLTKPYILPTDYIKIKDLDRLLLEGNIDTKQDIAKLFLASNLLPIKAVYMASTDLWYYAVALDGQNIVHFTDADIDYVLRKEEKHDVD